MAERISTPGGPKALAQQIRAARETLGLSVTEMANAAGVERSRLSKIEKGEFQTMNAAVQKMCKFLAISRRSGDPGAAASLDARLQRLSASCPEAVAAIGTLVAALEVRHLNAQSPRA